MPHPFDPTIHSLKSALANLSGVHADDVRLTLLFLEEGRRCNWPLCAGSLAGGDSFAARDLFAPLGVGVDMSVTGDRGVLRFTLPASFHDEAMRSGKDLSGLFDRPIDVEGPCLVFDVGHGSIDRLQAIYNIALAASLAVPGEAP